MIPKYIEDWLEIIENMNNSNTYKLAWGRAILECIKHNEYSVNDEVTITFDNIADKFIKYYWNQLFFFNLKQSPKNTNNAISKQVTILIDEFKEIKKSELPVWYNKGFDLIRNTDVFIKVKKEIIKILHENVSWRFKNSIKETLEIYRYNKDLKEPKIYFTIQNISYLEKYNIILAELLNFKWSQLLEDYNHQPKIVSKVKGISEASIKRNSLTKYKNLLLNQFKDGEIYDFYTNECLNVNEISIDHVIPWSFMYSDDIWNLVITNKSYNSSKSNSVPCESIIKKLKTRNELLVNILEGTSKEELKYAIDNKLVDKYYYDFRV